LDKDNGLTHIFGVTALVFLDQFACYVATIRHLFIAGGNQVLNVRSSLSARARSVRPTPKNS